MSDSCWMVIGDDCFGRLLVLGLCNVFLQGLYLRSLRSRGLWPGGLNDRVKNASGSATTIPDIACLQRARASQSRSMC